MAQIPEVGSEWINDYNCLKSKVVFADDEIVVVSFGIEGKGRQMVSAYEFANHFKRVARKVKHRRWVNLYKNGDTGGGWDNEKDAIEVAGDYRDQIAETRLIEWEVEE